MFRRLGVPVVDADQLSREVVRSGSEGFFRVAQVLPEAVHGDEIDRSLLGRIVFSDRNRRAQLEKIIHPLVRQEFLKEKARHEKEPLLVYEVPLLFEKGIDREMDVVIVVDVPVQIQRERLVRRSGLSEEEANRRILSQWTREERNSRADFILSGLLSEEETEKVLRELLPKLSGFARKEQERRVMKEVNKAVFPLAGHGTRFLPMTKASPKEMLPLVDKPVVQYTVEEAVASGVTQIIMVTGRGKRAIEDHFDISYELEDVLRAKGKWQLLEDVRRISFMAEVVYTRQKESLGLGHAVLCARNLVGDEPFAVALADEVIDSPVPSLEQLLSVYREFGAPVIGVQEVPAADVSHYGIISGHEVREGLFKVDSLVEKPRVDEAPSRWAVIGRYIMTPDIFSILESQKPGVGGEIQLTDALVTLASQRPLYAVKIEGRRYDTGDKGGFLKATVRYGLKNPELGPEFRTFLHEILDHPED